MSPPSQRCSDRDGEAERGRERDSGSLTKRTRPVFSGKDVSPEVCEVSLYVQVQDGGGSGGAQRRTVLAQQVLELLADLPDGQTDGGRRGGGRGGRGGGGFNHLSPAPPWQLVSFFFPSFLPSSPPQLLFFSAIFVIPAQPNIKV